MINVTIKGDEVLYQSSVGLVSVIVVPEPNPYYMCKIDGVNIDKLDEFKYLGILYVDECSLEGIFICFD